MGEKHTISVPTTGSSSLLVIFAVLCLTVFALLSISTVQANRRLSDRSSQAVTAYYAADLQAQDRLAQLRNGHIPEDVQELGDHIFAYICPLSDTQAIFVRVKIDEPKYHILQWQLRSTTQWQPEDGIDLWNGD